jgi:hypothetical protein
MQRNLVWEFLFGIFRNTLFQSSCGSFLNVVIHFCYIQLEEGNPKKTPRALAKLGRAGTCFGKPWGLYPSPSLKFMGFVLMKTLHSGTFKPCGILAWELFLWCLFGNLENLAFFPIWGSNFQLLHVSSSAPTMTEDPKLSHFWMCLRNQLVFIQLWKTWIMRDQKPQEMHAVWLMARNPAVYTTKITPELPNIASSYIHSV